VQSAPGEGTRVAFLFPQEAMKSSQNRVLSQQKAPSSYLQ
jgi:hypothetical protein